MDIVTVLFASVVIIAMLASAAWVTRGAMQHVDKFGDQPELKSRHLSKALFNFFALACLCAVILIRYLNLIANDLFIGLVIVILAGLGFKLSSEILSK